jgi:hypothetical protein
MPPRRCKPPARTQAEGAVRTDMDGGDLFALVGT